MASSFSSLANIVALALLLLLLTAGTSSANLSNNFYSKTCPNLFNAVKSVVKSAVAKEPRIGASILRLFFHDCFVDVIFCYPLCFLFIFYLYYSATCSSFTSLFKTSFSFTSHITATYSECVSFFNKGNCFM